jgi:DNA-binding Lrp family transcriptional regulator
VGQLYQDLVAAERQRGVGDGEFTTQQFADDTGMSENAARRRLKALRGDGVVDGEKRVVDGHSRAVWWMVEESDG